METEDRWYVRFRGHTLGPLTSEQVKSSVRRKELGPDDKLASTADPSWRPLRSQEEFFRCWESLSRPLPTELTPLPSPKILWQKKRTTAPIRAATRSTTATPSAAPASLAEELPPAKPIEKKAARATKPKKAKKAKKAPARRSARAKASVLAAIPEKPETIPAPANRAEVPSVAEPTLPEAKPQAQVTPEAPSPKLAEETLSLLEALRDWNRKEKENSQAMVKAEPAPAALSESAMREAAPLPAPMPAPEALGPIAFTRPSIPESESQPAERKNREIELRLNLVISKQFIFISSLVGALALAAILFTFTDLKKMRGPADSRLPGPSSPTVDPSPENDPIPQLKAPTRPKRD